MSDADIKAIVARAPTVSSRDDCGIDGDKRREVVLHEEDGEKRRIVICTDRIARMQSEALAAASVDTGAIQRNAYRSALAGLRSSRAAMLANPQMPEEFRAKTLASMDTAIAELESQIADAK